MSLSFINAGIAGCGHLGSIHCRLLHELSSENNHIRFNGVFDINPVRAAEISSKYGVTAYNSLPELIENINTLIIAAPTSVHYEIAARAIQSSVNVFIEKPVTSDLSEAEQLIKLKEKYKIKVQIGHVERFNPALKSAYEYIKDPMFIEAHRLSKFNPRGTDVSVIQDLMIHDIDIIFHISRSPLEKIDANGVSVISDNIDIANARLRFENGCVANLTASRISVKNMRKMRIFRKDAYISLDFLEGKSEIMMLADINEKSSDTQFVLNESKKIIISHPVIELNDYNPIKFELMSFFKCILNDTSEMVTLEEAKLAVQTAEEIIKIIRKQ